MTFELERELIEYSKRVFDYFNGKVNQYIPAKLNIRMRFDNTILANNMFNTVNLYLWNIIQHCADNDLNLLKTNIVFNIIHELSHIEQDLDYKLYNTDSQYKKQKENENNFNTYNYIYNNLNIISIDLQTYFNENNILSYMYYFRPYFTYRKFTSLDEYYKRCIKTIFSNDKNERISQQIDIAFNYNTIILDIDNKIFILRNQGFTNPDVTTFNIVIDFYHNNNNIKSNSSIDIYDNGAICIKSKMKHMYNFNFQAD